MTRLAAALSSFLAVRLNCLRSSSRGPSTAARNDLICFLMAFLQARLARRRFSDFRKFFLALRVCGIDRLQAVGGLRQRVRKWDYNPSGRPGKGAASAGGPVGVDQLGDGPAQQRLAAEG